MKTTEQTPNTPVVRRMTICNKAFARDFGRYVFFPMINLSGKWLTEIGFKSGHIIDVTCEDRKLIITIADEQKNLQ